MNTTVKRSLSGAIFLAVMLGGLLVGRPFFAILFAFITGGMLYEFYGLSMGPAYKAAQFTAVLCGILLFLAAHCFFFQELPLSTLVVLALLLLLLLMVLTLFHKGHDEFPKTAFLYTGLLYIAFPLMLSNAVVSRGGTFSGLLMLAFFCIIWASDVGAYCFGMLFGQKGGRKLCPSISPKKSWAGFWGGLFLALVAGAVLHFTGMVSFPLVHCLAMALLMALAGVAGDLLESLWKRAFGIKDSGHLIPGHGGLMDRFDSSLFAIPTGVIYLVLTGLF